MIVLAFTSVRSQLTASLVVHQSYSGIGHWCCRECSPGQRVLVAGSQTFVLDWRLGPRRSAGRHDVLVLQMKQERPPETWMFPGFRPEHSLVEESGLPSSRGLLLFGSREDEPVVRPNPGLNPW
jgi:hypothetical protein